MAVEAPRPAPSLAFTRRAWLRAALLAQYGADDERGTRALLLLMAT
jgi:hypothetical protein